MFYFDGNILHYGLQSKSQQEFFVSFTKMIIEYKPQSYRCHSIISEFNFLSNRPLLHNWVKELIVLLGEVIGPVSYLTFMYNQNNSVNVER